jgi:hypothetical protein
MSIFIGSGSISNVLFSSGPGDIPSSGSFLQLQKNTFGGTSGSGPWTWTDNNGIVTDVITGPLDSSGSVGWNFSGSTTIGIVSSSLVGYFNCSSSAEPFTIQFFGTLNNLAGAQSLIGNPNYGESAFTKTIQFVSQSSSQMNVQFRPLVDGDVRGVLVDYIAGNATGITITYNGSGSMYNASGSVYQNGILKGSTEVVGGPFTIFCTGSGFDVDGNKYVRLFRPKSVPSRGNGLVGQVGSIYIWNRVLSDEEILKAYNFASNGGTTQAQTVYLGNELVFAQPATTTTTTTTTTSTTTTLGPLSVQTLVVAGGGSGGTGTGGGGGAGGVVYSSSLTLPNGTYAVNVGTGGAAVGNNGGSSPSGKRGQDSSFVSGAVIVSASGGGGGKGYDIALGAANNGGSGGGTTANTSTGGTGISGQGFAGGNWNGSDNGCGSGGGGASQTGRQPTGAYPNGSGGNGASGSAYTIRSGTSVFYGGGGGGGNYVTSVNPGTGGPGGGTAGTKTATNPSSASANTGGGGGGSFRSAVGDNNGISGNGGSGIIVVAYLTSSAGGKTITGGIEETYDSGSLTYKSHTFLSSSNLVIS